jgi:hypothetical protein
MAGCTPTAELYVGKQVTAAPIVQLENGVDVSGTWQTFDLIIDYSYTAAAGSIEFTGQGQLSQHYQTVYNRVRSMRVYLFFLDADGRVITTIDIPAFLTTTEDTFSFKRVLPAGDEIKGFSFGYRGVAYEKDGYDYFDSLP